MDFLFKNISHDDKNEYLKQINIFHKTYNRQETIVIEGDECKNLYYINSGLVVAKNIYFDGHESIIKILTNNDTFGESLLFSNIKEYKASFVCEQKTTVSFISIDDLNLLMKLNHNISINLLNRISNNLISLNDHIKILNKKTVRKKICTFLYFQYVSRGQTTFPVLFNKTDLASYLNIERPTLSKEVNQLVNENIIANKGNLYTLINIKEIEKNL